MQPSSNNPVAPWILPALSALVIAALAVAAFTHGIEWGTVATDFFWILGFNGAPALVGQVGAAAVKPLVQRFDAHLQLHADQVSQAQTSGPSAIVFPRTPEPPRG